MKQEIYKREILKKLVTLVLVLVLGVSTILIGTTSFADEWDEPDMPDSVEFMDSQGLTYFGFDDESYLEAGVKVEDNEKISGEIVIPATIKEEKSGKVYKVICPELDHNFAYCTKITSVVLPATWNTVDEWCFMSCENLKTVTLKAKSIKIIRDMAFGNCGKLKTVKNINKVKEIGESSFQGCSSLKKLNLDSVTKIGVFAFSKCYKLDSIKIGKKFKELQESAFNGCKNLKTITIKSTKLKKVHKKAFEGTSHKITIKVPKKKLKAYKKLFKNKGNKKVVVKAI